MLKGLVWISTQELGCLSTSSLIWSTSISSTEPGIMPQCDLWALPRRFPAPTLTILAKSGMSRDVTLREQATAPASSSLGETRRRLLVRQDKRYI